MPRDVKRKWEDWINDAQSVSDLIPFIKQLSDNIDTNNMKQLLQEALQNTNVNALSGIMISQNIEMILPKDCLQRIESFAHCVQLTKVSQLFEELHDLNENILRQSRELIIKKELGVTDKNTVWEIDEDDCFQTTVENAKNGDTIILEEGDYKFSDFRLFCGKVLQIFGSENVTIWIPDTLESGYEALPFDKGSKIYFKGLHIRTSFDDINFAGDFEGLLICNGSSVWIDDCEISSHEYGFRVEAHSNLTITNSMFTGYSNSASIVIEEASGLNQKCKSVTIQNCIFYDNAILRHDPIIVLSKRSTSETITIVGNLFESVDEIPIGHYESRLPVVDFRRSTVHSNDINFDKKATNGLRRYIKTML